MFLKLLTRCDPKLKTITEKCEKSSISNEQMGNCGYRPSILLSACIKTDKLRPLLRIPPLPEVPMIRPVRSEEPRCHTDVSYHDRVLPVHDTTRQKITSAPINFDSFFVMHAGARFIYITAPTRPARTPWTKSLATSTTHLRSISPGLPAPPCRSCASPRSRCSSAGFAPPWSAAGPTRGGESPSLGAGSAGEAGASSNKLRRTCRTSGACLRSSRYSAGFAPSTCPCSNARYASGLASTGNSRSQECAGPLRTTQVSTSQARTGSSARRESSRSPFCHGLPSRSGGT